MTPLNLALLFSFFTDVYDLPKDLLSSLCYVESHHEIHAINKYDKGSPSLGLCQIKMDTARMVGYRGSKEYLMVPSINAHYAAKYLKRQLDRYKGDPVKAIAAYNAGTYREGKPGVPLNKQYVRKVLHQWLKKP